MVSAGPSSTARPSWADDSWDSTILHLDMDAYFLSVELLDQPNLRGVPAVVGGRSGRSVVTSASYEARKFGIRSAMPMAHALSLYPRLVVIEPNREKYTHASRQVMDVLQQVTPAVEQLSIDEAFIDVSGARRRLGTPAQIAHLIKSRVREVTGLPSTVGVAATKSGLERSERILATDFVAATSRVREVTGLPSTVGVAATKSVAKILSDRSKPDGIGVVPADQTRAYLAPLPVEVIWGVGPKLLRRLNNADIYTVDDLANREPERMRRWLGAIGPQIVALARGEDPRTVQPRQEAKSVSVEHTFEFDITDAAALEKYLLDLAYECARRVRNEGLE